MRNNDLDAFKETLTSVYSLYRTDLSQDIIELWWRALKPHNLTDVRKALAEHVAEPEGGQFFPKPADVIKSIAKNTTDPIHRCWNCQGDLAKLGSAKLRFGYVCGPCYQDYLEGKWSWHKAQAKAA